MSRMALWNMYQNASPPNQHHTTSPPELQREALNLQRESPSPIPPAQSPIISIKRERDQNDINDYHVPPAKRGLVRTNSDLNRKSSINNNHHHISNNNNSHLTPIKITNKSLDRSESPNVENSSHHRSPTNHKQQNGLDNLGTTMLNGMQFKVISKGEIIFEHFCNFFFNLKIIFPIQSLNKIKFSIQCFFLIFIINTDPKLNIYTIENSSTGEPQLVVKLEVNGISFEGVLFPNPNSSPSASTTSLTPSNASTEPMVSPAKNPSPPSINDDHKMSHKSMVSS